MKDNMQHINNIVHLEPDGGVLVHTTCWRPRPAAPNPEQPGDRVALMIYHPTNAEDFCPCGSGKRFGVCCQLLPYWRPVCPNPGEQGYHLMHPQSASFMNVDAHAVHALLQDDERLYCVEDSPQRTFWTYWGSPPLHIPQGTLCFGDIELRERRTLLITALSDVCIEVLLDLVRPLKLGTPHIQEKPFPFSQIVKPLRRTSARKHRRKS